MVIMIENVPSIAFSFEFRDAGLGLQGAFLDLPPRCAFVIRDNLIESFLSRESVMYFLPYRLEFGLQRVVLLLQSGILVLEPTGAILAEVSYIGFEGAGTIRFL
jgi:hypothetical protein